MLAGLHLKDHQRQADEEDGDEIWYQVSAAAVLADNS
jgi:hypothetical protein